MDLFDFLNKRLAAHDSLDAQGKASSVQSQLLELRREHEQLRLLTRALWSLLKQTQGLDDADLKRHVLAAQEGARKQAAASPYWNCPECRHQVPMTVKTCPYCGHQIADEDLL